MLGHDLEEVCLDAGHKVMAWDVDELDITKADKVKDGFPQPDVLINCAAYTKVDDAETNRDAAYRINAEGPLNLARECAEKKIRFIHISTDYVFNGEAELPYPERAQTNPINIYGASKLAGEKAVRGTGGDFLVIRSQSLFGVHGHNFVKAIARKARTEGGPLKVVNDQVMTPTFTGHLAKGILNVVDKDATGILHLSASGSCTWFEFAQQILKELKLDVEVVPISSEELSLPAQRPAYSVLSNRKYRLLTGENLPSWQEGLKAYLSRKGAIPS